MPLNISLVLSGLEPPEVQEHSKEEFFMQNRTISVLIILSVMLVGIAPLTLAVPEGNGDPIARMMGMVSGIQTSLARLVSQVQAHGDSIAQIQSNTSRLTAATNKLESNTERIVNRMQEQYVDQNEMNLRLTNWINNDKVDIANLYDLYDQSHASTVTQLVHLEDDKFGNALGWNPGDNQQVFTILNSNVTPQSVIALTVDGGMADCHVRKLFTDESPRFLIRCSNGVEEGAVLNYTLTNPVA